ncbi:MAG TPA: hypothetical protein ENI08_02190 [Candidatus Dependentiae bacterium]|nr:hypothetical protein [Candidatus Dependentiae bacterium]
MLEYETIKLLGGAEVLVDFSRRLTRCRGCDKQIRFGVTKNNKNMPIIQIGEDWQAHFADCVKADSFRKINEVGENQEALNNF